MFFTGNEQGFFSIDPATGKLFAIKEIDRETLDSDEFILELEALQRDNTLKGGTARVKINIEDINDNRPQFEVSAFQKSILEGVPNGEEILKFEAYDKDIVRSHFNLLEIDDVFSFFSPLINLKLHGASSYSHVEPKIIGS